MSHVPFPLMTLFAIVASVATTQADDHSSEKVFRYLIKEGDSLRLIASQRFHDARRWRSLARWNKLEPPYDLEIGQELVFQIYPPFPFDVKAPSGTASAPLAPPPPTYATAKAEIVREARAKITEPPPPEENAFERGRKLFEQEKYEAALTSFRRSRTENGDYLPAWFLELKTLKKLGRNDEAREFTHDFVKEHPEVQAIPMIRGALK